MILLTNAVRANSCEAKAYFSPHQDIEQVVLDSLSVSKRYVHLSLYGISNRRLADKLLELHRRGIEVIVCLDKLQSKGKYDLHGDLAKSGIPVIIKRTRTLEHNKFAVIDGQRVLMGSWNWSKSAQRQDNSDVVLYDCPEEVQKFETAFQDILNRDREPFVGHTTVSPSHIER
jgi:mitochondrial cardiolipin hydrolase